MDDRQPAEQQPVDVGDYRQMIGRFATGVGVVTASSGGERFAMTANSITSVSTEPLLVLASFMHDSDTGHAVRKSSRFGLNILDAERGREIAGMCAGKRDPLSGGDQLCDIETRSGPDGVPLIEGSLECLVCAVEQIHAIGDHDVVIGRATRVPEAETSGDPLVFYAGAFWRLGEARA